MGGPGEQAGRPELGWDRLGGRRLGASRSPARPSRLRRQEDGAGAAVTAAEAANLALCLRPAPTTAALIPLPVEPSGDASK